jgi:hypothetical protein
MSPRVITALLVTLALAGQAHATRVMQQPEEAYELSLGQVSLPQRVGGSVIFKPCPDCQTVGLRVTAATRYFVSGQEVTVDALAKATENLASTTHVAVFFDKASKFVNRLKIN